MARKKAHPPPAPEPVQPERRRYGTGSIEIKADGTIRARLPKKLDPKRTAKEFSPGHVAEATAWLDGYLNPQPVAPPAPAVVTLSIWGGHWWQTFVEPIRPPNTAKWYLYALAQLETLGDMPITDVRVSMLQGVVGALVKRVEAATIHGIAGVWRRCLEAAIDDQLIAQNPAKRLMLPKIPKRAPARSITADEVAELWPAIRDRRFEGAYAVILGCGLRIGEILGLHWEHVDFERHQIWVQHQFTNGHWRDLPKGHNPHWVPLPEDVELALRRHRLRQPPEYVLVMQSPHRGKKRRSGPTPWSRNAVAMDLATIVGELELDHLTPHSGRHGLASHLMSNGVPPTVIAERLGNTPAVVLNVYAHAAPADRIRADGLVDDYIGGDTEDDPGTEIEASG